MFIIFYNLLINHTEGKNLHISNVSGLIAMFEIFLQMKLNGLGRYLFCFN